MVRGRGGKQATRWHDVVVLEPHPSAGVRDRVRRLTGRIAATLVMAGALVLAPMVVGVAQATAPPPSTPDTNPFIPEDANIGDCISALPRPDCGSREQGGSGQYLVLVVLLGAMGFIGWRVARGVRSRERSGVASGQDRRGQ
jgi:hypothetical protein